MKKQSKLPIPRKLLFACLAHMYDRGGLRSAAAQAPAATPAPAIDKAAADRGKGTFSSSCSFCHGSQATGTEQAPNLLRSPLVFQDHDGDTLGPFLKQGRPTLGMPAFPTLSAAAGAGYRSVSALAYPGGSRQTAPGNRVAGRRSQSRTGLLQWRGQVQHLPLRHRRPGAYRIERSTPRADDSLSDTSGKTLQVTRCAAVRPIRFREAGVSRRVYGFSRWMTPACITPGPGSAQNQST